MLCFPLSGEVGYGIDGVVGEERTGEECGVVWVGVELDAGSVELEPAVGAGWGFVEGGDAHGWMLMSLCQSLIV